MNIWKRNKVRESQSKIKILNPDMLVTYQIYKSVELHLQGKFNFTTYSSLKTLTENSFLKESGDLRMAVRIIYTNAPARLERLKMSLVVAMNYTLKHYLRSQCARDFIYHDIFGKDFVVNAKPIEELPYKIGEESSWLHEEDDKIINRFKEVYLWVIEPHS